MSILYEPVNTHWFYKVNDDNWMPFTYIDSDKIQQSYEGKGPKIITTDNGRFDVNITNKTRTPNYWNSDITEIRLCSWFYKTFKKDYIPYDENICNILEDEYKKALINNKWNIQVKLENDEIIYFQTQNKMLHFIDLKDISKYFWNELVPTRSIRRGLSKFEIDSGYEYNKNIDHLIFVIPGISSGIILKYRSDVDVVDQLRNMGCQLIKTHYKNLYEQDEVGLIEVLPVPWQNQVHSSNAKIDDTLKTITLESLPKFRKMANNTVLDVLSYTSPFYCQNIINTVGNTINENYIKFCNRNPNFNGTISIIGHSLGGLILFDLLCNQKYKTQSIFDIRDRVNDSTNTGRRLSGTGQTIVNYPQLLFEPKMSFALGSPIGLFVALRDTNGLGLDFKLPTCLNFYNIFHPYDPIAYRIEGLINPELSKKQPVKIPYHKGGKRKHLEIKETMVRVKNELKQKVFVTYKNIFDKISLPTSSSSPQDQSDRDEQIKKDVDDIIQFKSSLDSKMAVDVKSDLTTSSLDQNIEFGNLNNLKRIDYVLEAGPFEVINEYLYALSSHIGYWESEDAMLFMVKELYSTLGIIPEVQNN